MKKLKLIINNDKRNFTKNTFFVKKEMQTILNLYAKMVSSGQWKDYGLSIGPKEVSFDFYQRSSDKPVYKILKNFSPKHDNEKFLLKDKNGFIIERSSNLNLLIKKRNWLKLKTVG
ncbi:MAG: hypothetical protein CL687_01845 [Candidatus Pelagibacter sp.]|nr:hypothetical protein [Candidatus Pelagibacter sp.]OUW24347.1 MAG: hypothetical protein CBD34_01120 [Rickettsiales bacterium TMED174]|tara:strand:- start:79 stop:426 length:348 start_codon:yes stop_codon:yes gene_type:complete